VSPLDSLFFFVFLVLAFLFLFALRGAVNGFSLVLDRLFFLVFYLVLILLFGWIGISSAGLLGWLIRSLNSFFSVVCFGSGGVIEGAFSLTFSTGMVSSAFSSFTAVSSLLISTSFVTSLTTTSSFFEDCLSSDSRSISSNFSYSLSFLSLSTLSLGASANDSEYFSLFSSIISSENPSSYSSEDGSDLSL